MLEGKEIINKMINYGIKIPIRLSSAGRNDAREETIQLFGVYK